jgi:hypothetical protein
MSRPNNSVADFKIFPVEDAGEYKWVTQNINYLVTADFIPIKVKNPEIVESFMAKHKATFISANRQFLGIAPVRYTNIVFGLCYLAEKDRLEFSEIIHINNGEILNQTIKEMKFVMDTIKIFMTYIGDPNFEVLEERREPVVLPVSKHEKKEPENPASTASMRRKLHFQMKALQNIVDKIDKIYDGDLPDDKYFDLTLCHLGEIQKRTEKMIESITEKDLRDSFLPTINKTVMECQGYIDEIIHLSNEIKGDELEVLTLRFELISGASAEMADRLRRESQRRDRERTHTKPGGEMITLPTTQLPPNGKTTISFGGVKHELLNLQ